MDTSILRDWLKEIVPWGHVDRYVQFVAEEGDSEHGVTRLRVNLFTDNHVYSIVSVTSPSTQSPEGYLGCTMSNRKPRAGEDWTRGGDLPDGKLTRETWDRIVQAIVQCELVPLQVAPPSMPNTDEACVGEVKV